MASDEKGRPTAVNTLVYAFYGLGALPRSRGGSSAQGSDGPCEIFGRSRHAATVHLVGIQSGSEGDALEARAVDGPHTLGALHVRDPNALSCEIAACSKRCGTVVML